MDVIIKKTDKNERAFEIVKMLPDYFDSKDLENIKNDLVNYELYGAFKDNEMVGFVCFKELNPSSIEIAWMAVVPDYQDKGVGTALFSEGIEMLGRSYDACEVKTLADTISDEGYKRTRNFYEKLGFIPLEIVDPYPSWSPGNPCQIFVKFLKS